MRKLSIVVTIVILMAIIISVSPIMAKEQSWNLKSIIERNTDFTIDLYSILRKEPGNIFFLYTASRARLP